MFGLGLPEIAIILVIVLIVFGPSKLPELARGLGKGLREFKKATEDFKSTMDEELHRPEPPQSRSTYNEYPAQISPPQGTQPVQPPQSLADAKLTPLGQLPASQLSPDQKQPAPAVQGPTAPGSTEHKG